MTDKEPDIWEALLTATESQKQSIVFKGSTMLSEASYNKTMSTLILKFKRSPGAYSFFNVPSGVVETFFACEQRGDSPGKYFTKNIKDIYPFKKII